MTETQPPGPPSAFIDRWVHMLAAEFPGGRALDVAAGKGRHALALAAAGFQTVAIDIQLDALVSARGFAQRRGLNLAVACADLTAMPLPRRRFQIIVVTRYLDRALFPSLRDALCDGGVLLYETFTENQLRYDRGPRSPHHLLAPGELRTLMIGLHVLFDEEVSAPEAVARIAARRRG